MRRCPKGRYCFDSACEMSLSDTSASPSSCNFCYTRAALRGVAVRVLKAIGLALLFLILGAAGTLAIIVGSSSFIDTQTKVKLPSDPFVYTDAWERGYVSAEGTFTIDNDRPAFPIQVTKIRCDRNEKSCTAARAEIAFGHMLHVELSTHEITLWNDTTVHFREDAICVQYIYTIDRANKRVIGTRTTKPNVTGCEIFENKPLTLSLVNGFDVWWRLNQEAVAKVSPFMWGGVVAWWLLLIFFVWRWRRTPAPHLAT